jgi:hypothetical protein
MKNTIAVALALVATTGTSLAGASTYTYTFNDMSYVPDKAKNNFNTSRYWESRGADRWGTVWESPYTFSTTYPSQTGYAHFHIGFKGQEECIDTSTQTIGHFVNGKCVPLDVNVNRGPFGSHWPNQALYFQLVTNDGKMVPFVVTTIDVYNPATESITLFVRKTDGGWFYWTPLHGYGNGTPSYYRWSLTSGYTGKFTAMAWMPAADALTSVGRVTVTD